MISSLLGKKIGMTQVYDAQNVLVPVSVVEAGPCSVVQVKTVATDGYNAVQIGFSQKKPKNTAAGEAGHAKKAGLDVAPRVLSEVRLKDAPTLKVGDVVTVAAFTEGMLVDVSGITKGKGFQGVVRRHKFAGSVQTHGTHEYRRHGGSIGTNMTPGRTKLGMRMSGQHGNKRVSVLSQRVAKVIADQHLVLVHGGVPGAKGGVVELRGAIKRRGGRPAK